ncbi:heme o synthase [Alicyclobacillus mengziensis]|uniref:Protoheme IX farnesyltransferase n=1 Tax=Alicyclobacillus mengziensis TaxID=2931921 RepID=A0A9X7Z742_9BACL|nr:heme o synthase [Alicyclobacillus mengziensis]QSO46848.1 heme o synthase [Alicyclobacillus mengziensis]
MNMKGLDVAPETAVAVMPRRFLQLMSGYWSLTKPGIMVMLLYTAFTGMLLANHGIPSVHTVVFTLLGLALSTGGSAALNMWYDRDIDAVMKRTGSRPIPSGVIKPNQALIFGIALIALSFLLMSVFLNIVAALLSFAGAFYYVVIYTFWLKRRTPQNIVIGGGAGAMPPLVGWAGVTGHVSLTAVLLFLIIFLWTPPHFWSLALYKNSDYQRAGVPMMPVVRGGTVTKWQSFYYGIALLAGSLALPLVTKLNALYPITAIVLGCGFLYFLFRTLREDEGSFVWARRTFLFSLAYLLVLFIAVDLSIL